MDGSTDIQHSTNTWHAMSCGPWKIESLWWLLLIPGYPQSLPAMEKSFVKVAGENRKCWSPRFKGIRPRPCMRALGIGRSLPWFSCAFGRFFYRHSKNKLRHRSHRHPLIKRLCPRRFASLSAGQCRNTRRSNRLPDSAYPIVWRPKLWSPLPKKGREQRHPAGR